MVELPKPKPSPKVRKALKRGKRPRKVRKTSRAKLAREADRLWSLVVRKRGACEITGKTENLQAAHGFSRRYRATRWLPINGFCLSAQKHVYYTHRPLEWDQYLREAWGPAVYEELRARAINGCAFPPMYEEIIRGLTAELEGK